MRRKDREITDPAHIDAVIRGCDCCRLGFCDAGEVYILPLNFGYENREGKRTFYFHSAREGRKIALIAGKPAVGFELDRGYRLVPGDTACQYGARFQSVIGTGRVSFVEEDAERRMALASLMRQATGREDGWEFSDAMLRSVCIYKLEVDTISCKEHE